MTDPVSRAADPGHDVTVSREMPAQMDEAATSGEHWKILITSGMGFFADAYDLFIIGMVASMIKGEWHLASYQNSLLSSVALLTSAVGRSCSARSPTGSAGGRSTATRCSCWLSARSRPRSRRTSDG
jgi:hypothetical protein